MRTDLDICVCGDFRRDHEVGDGPCRLRGGPHAGIRCAAFRFSREASAEEVEQQEDIEREIPIMSYPVSAPTIGGKLVEAIDDELHAAKRHGEKFNSLHEAYAVILEEVDELWDIARLKRKDRSAEELRKEFVQIAAMAIKGYQSMENLVGGDV